jgi:hypothetical protein
MVVNRSRTADLPQRHRKRNALQPPSRTEKAPESPENPAVPQIAASRRADLTSAKRGFPRCFADKSKRA